MAKKKPAAKKETAKEKPAEKKDAAKEIPSDKKAAAKKAPSQITHKKIKVNFWRTKLHSEALGIYQKLKYQAKTRQFSKTFEIQGVVEEDGEKKYIIAYNKDDWKNKPDEEKRLILRLFTIMEEGIGVEKGGNFVAGTELSITHSIIQSYEIKHPAAVFIVTIPGSNVLTKIVKGWRLRGTRWSFPLLPEEKQDLLVMVKARGTIGMGIDYDIWIGKKKVARVDGQRVQKEWEIEVYDEDYAKDKLFLKMLMLFGCICNFVKSTDKIIEKLFNDMKDSGTTTFKPPKQELDLFKNPRMLRG